mmetsp:Transcript_161262/g.517717  ORF Transcript_161262/g.517717 Transcript_161262/m.517717 type:complete len:222 (+) Transcript_161262:451-1116(+)
MLDLQHLRCCGLRCFCCRFFERCLGGGLFSHSLHSTQQLHFLVLIGLHALQNLLLERLADDYFPTWGNSSSGNPGRIIGGSLTCCVLLLFRSLGGSNLAAPPFGASMTDGLLLLLLLLHLLLLLLLRANCSNGNFGRLPSGSLICCVRPLLRSLSRVRRRGGSHGPKTDSLRAMELPPIMPSGIGTAVVLPCRLIARLPSRHSCTMDRTTQLRAMLPMQVE